MKSIYVIIQNTDNTLSGVVSYFAFDDIEECRDYLKNVKHFTPCDCGEMNFRNNETFYKIIPLLLEESEHEI